MHEPDGVTELLHEWADGDKAALDKVLPMVYDELRKVAHVQFKQVGGNLQATELVDMVYMRLLESKKVRFESRKHFFWYASQIIRRLLVDQVRAQLAQKRGAGIAGDTYETGPDARCLHNPDGETLIALDQALSRLEKTDPDRCRIVEMRTFAGMTVDEIAIVLDCSPATIKRQWNAATRWLFFELNR